MTRSFTGGVSERGPKTSTAAIPTMITSVIKGFMCCTSALHSAAPKHARRPAPLAIMAPIVQRINTPAGHEGHEGEKT